MRRNPSRRIQQRPTRRKSNGSVSITAGEKIGEGRKNCPSRQAWTQSGSGERRIDQRHSPRVHSRVQKGESKSAVAAPSGFAASRPRRAGDDFTKSIRAEIKSRLPRVNRAIHAVKALESLGSNCRCQPRTRRSDLYSSIPFTKKKSAARSSVRNRVWFTSEFPELTSREMRIAHPIKICISPNALRCTHLNFHII